MSQYSNTGGRKPHGIYTIRFHYDALWNVAARLHRLRRKVLRVFHPPVSGEWTVEVWYTKEV